MNWIAAVATGLGIVLALIIVYLRTSARDLRGISDTKERHDVKSANRDLALKFVGGLALIGTLVLSVATYRETQQTTRVAQGTLNATQQGQAAERYTKGVEQLASDNEAERIGGIATLRSLLSNPDHHNAVVDVLAAFVRSAAKPPTVPLQLTQLTKPCEDRPPVQPPLDVQAAMTALAERDARGERRLDLRGAYLVGIELSAKAELTGALLDYANLSYAKLWGVGFETASLRHVELVQACLLEGRLKAATTDFANLEGAVLNGADLSGSRFHCANLRRAGLIGATITSLSHAHLKGAVLRQAHLEGAILDRVDLTDAHLDEANLKRASLQFANGVTDSQLQSARTDAQTERPMRAEPWPTNCS